MTTQENIPNGNYFENINRNRYMITDREYFENNWNIGHHHAVFGAILPFYNCTKNKTARRRFCWRLPRYARSDVMASVTYSSRSHNGISL